LNIRIVVAEVCDTSSMVFLMAFGTYKAWQEFTRKGFK
jgi:hypothetical protein